MKLPEGLYIGEMKDGKANGKGTLIFSDGNSYVGDFTDNKPSGKGMITYVENGVANTKELNADKIHTDWYKSQQAQVKVGDEVKETTPEYI